MRDLRRSVLAVDAASSAVCGLLGGGRLLLFDGRKPADPDAPANQHPIAALHFSSDPFLAPVAGRAQADVLPDLVVMRAGRPTWFRAVTSRGAPVLDGTVGVAEQEGERYDLELDRAEVDLDDVVRVEQLVYVEPQAERSRA